MYASRRLRTSPDAQDSALVARLSADLHVPLFAVGSPGVGEGDLLAAAFGKRIVWFREGAAPPASLAWADSERIAIAGGLAAATKGAVRGLFSPAGRMEHAVVQVAGTDFFLDARGGGLGAAGLEERVARYAPGAAWRPIESDGFLESVAAAMRRRSTSGSQAMRYATSLLESIAATPKLSAAAAYSWAPDVIFLGAHRLADQRRIVAHELTHMMEEDQPALYRALKEFVLASVPGYKPFQRMLESEGYLPEGIEDELVAHCVEAFLGDPAESARFLGRAPTLFEQLRSFCIRALAWLESHIGHRLGSGAIAAQSQSFEGLRAPVLSTMSAYRAGECYGARREGQPVGHATPAP